MEQKKNLSMWKWYYQRRSHQRSELYLESKGSVWSHFGPMASITLDEASRMCPRVEDTKRLETLYPNEKYHWGSLLGIMFCRPHFESSLITIGIAAKEVYLSWVMRPDGTFAYHPIKLFFDWFTQNYSLERQAPELDLVKAWKIAGFVDRRHPVYHQYARLENEYHTIRCFLGPCKAMVTILNGEECEKESAESIGTHIASVLNEGYTFPKSGSIHMTMLLIGVVWYPIKLSYCHLATTFLVTIWYKYSWLFRSIATRWSSLVFLWYSQTRRFFKINTYLNMQDQQRPWTQ